MPALGQNPLLLLAQRVARFEGVQPGGAAGVPGAAQVHVAEAQHAGGVEALDGLDGVVAQEGVVVPGVAVGVHEDEDGGQGGVVRDDVGEVGHYFVAFVEGGGERGRGGVVDGVEGEGVGGEVGAEPGGVVGGGARDDEDEGVVLGGGCGGGGGEGGADGAEEAFGGG